MFGDLFGDMEAKQAALKEKLAQLTVEEEVGDGAVRITANGNREITNVQLDRTKLDPEDWEQLEDLLLVGINRVLAKAAETEATETESLLKDMLPPGMGDMGNLFG